MLRGTQNSQFRKFPVRKPLPKQGENNQAAANSEDQVVGEIEKITLDITGDAGEKLHSEGEKIEMVTSEGTGIRLEKSKIEQVKRTSSVRCTEELDVIVQSKKGSLSHINKKLTEHQSSDGTFSATLETKTDQIPSQGNEKHTEKHTKVKHTITITPSGDKTETTEKHTDILLSSGETLCIDEQETLTRSGSDSQEEIFTNKQHLITFFPSPVVQLHVLDLLVVGKSYNIGDFAGSVPGLHSMMLTGIYAPEPVWKHTSCTLSVESGDESGKYLVIEAEVDAKKSNTTYGITGKYQVGVNLQKQGDGVICTQIKGLSGDISVPGPLYYAVSAFSSNSFNLGAYGAGSSDEPLALPVLLTDNKDGTFNLKIEVDGSKLNLTGVTYLMHALLEKFGFSKPSALEGKIDVAHALTNTNVMKK